MSDKNSANDVIFSYTSGAASSFLTLVATEITELATGGDRLIAGAVCFSALTASLRISAFLAFRNKISVKILQYLAGFAASGILTGAVSVWINHDQNPERVETTAPASQQSVAVGESKRPALSSSSAPPPVCIS